MLDLPPALSPWRSLLSLLPRDVALGLGPSILRLALAVGPLRTRARRGEGEPDGFDGLGRRGTFDRLVLSDWLLASEVPMEFLRRAAVGELAFLEVARREPAHSLSTMAVFDAGPDQLGAPRVVQVAALVVLAQRAEAAGAGFRWGILQAADRAVLPCATASHVGTLVAARTPASAQVDDVAAWHARARADGCEELWVVGSRGITAEADRLGDGWLAIDQIVDPEVRAADVSARAPRKTRTDAVLELPEDRLCARVLRDPLEVAAPRPAGLAPKRRAVSDLVFASNGRKVLARAHDGGIVAFAVPNSPRAGMSRPKLYFQNHGRRVVAVAWHQRSVIAATCTGGMLAVHSTSSRASALVDQRVPVAATGLAFVPHAHDKLSPMGLVRYGPKLVPLIPDAEGTLFELGSFFEPPIAVVAERVRALICQPYTGTVVFVGRGHTAAEPSGAPAEGRTSRPALLLPESRWSLVALSEHHSTRAPTVVHLEGDGSFETFFGHGATAVHPTYGLVAVQQREHAWTIHSRHAPIDLAPDAPARVVGVAVDPRADDAPSLVLLDADRRGLSLVGRSSSRALAPSTERIAHVAVSHAGPEIAYVTESGTLVVLSTQHDQPLARHVPEAGR